MDTDLVPTAIEWVDRSPTTFLDDMQIQVDPMGVLITTPSGNTGTFYPWHQVNRIDYRKPLS